MCSGQAISCRCEIRAARFNFKDENLQVEAIEEIYCPACSGAVSFNPEAMLIDNAWIIEYDMDVVRFTGQKIPHIDVNLSRSFDEGYCTWRGYIQPTISILSGREKLLKYTKKPRIYLEEVIEMGYRANGA
jgi:hypothetical protein